MRALDDLVVIGASGLAGGGAGLMVIAGIMRRQAAALERIQRMAGEALRIAREARNDDPGTSPGSR